jgi:peptidoglycan/LPS O-acetylase OafA/YrhL
MQLETLLDLPVSDRRSDGIDLLRGILALWVFFSHLLPWGVAVSGGNDAIALPIKLLTWLFQSNGETHPAVIGFIVLSGYCIHRNGFRRDSGSLRGYIVRRFFRIWPVYLLATLVGMVCFAASSSINAPLASALSATQGITFRCLGVKLSGISALLPSVHQCSFLGNAPLTTAMVEIWLYALYAAAVLLFLRRFPEKYFWGALTAVWVAGMIYLSRHQEYLPWWHNGSLLGFSLYWWTGAAFVGGSFSKTICGIWKLLLITWVMFTVLLLLKATDSLWVVEVRKVVFSLLFGLVTVNLDQAENRKFVAGAFLGKSGYSLYALHAPLLVLLLLTGVSWWIVLPTVIGVAILVNRLYENPFIRIGKRMARSNFPKDN